MSLAPEPDADPLPAVDPPDLDRLRRLLGTAELAWLLDRVRRRMSRGQPLTGTVTLSAASEAQRRAVARLLGRPPRSGDGALSVTLDALDDLLRCSGACPAGLAAAVVVLTGPVPDTSARLAEEQRAWERAYAPLDALVSRRAGYAGWYEGIRASGLVRRLAGTAATARTLLADAATLLAALPADGEPVGVFTARLLGDAHALDDDRRVTTLVFGAARSLTDVPDGTGAEWRREVWASVGLLRDELSTTVLTLGLPGDARTSTGRALAACREVGQPVIITLRQLVRDPPALSAGRLFVCENPAVLSVAADRLGTRCPPLVCVNGHPSAAVRRLLRLCTRAGAQIRYHGDFDWGGLRIANGLFDDLPVHPWRFGAADYRAIVTGRPLVGPPATASWDPDLAVAMAERGLAVEEELVLDDLIDDLTA